MAYTYKGKEREALEAPRKADHDPRKRAKCGTPAGRRRHQRHGEEVCDPCRFAWNAYIAEYRAGSTTGRKNQPESVCGTPAGCMAHYRRGEDVCDACRAAQSAYRKRLRTAKAVAA